jgi:hypothetical protein
VRSADDGPPAQVVQALAPAAEYSAGVQLEQAAALVWPGSAENVPAGQIEQAATLVCPGSPENVPAAQGMQIVAPAAEYVPAAQGVQTDAAAAEDVPAAHGEQTVAAAAEYVPALQVVHSDQPSMFHTAMKPLAVIEPSESKVILRKPVVDL